MSSQRDTTLPGGRIVAYDALRVFAILTVVAIHTLMPYREVLPESAPVRVLDDVLHYAVPLFVFISGALVWSRPWARGPRAYRDFVARRMRLIGLPYLGWAALYSALYVARAQDVTEASGQLPGLIVTGHVWYHLYFIPMLLTFYLLTPLASRVAQASPEALLVVAYVLRIVAGPPITHAVADLHPLAGQYATHVLSHLPHMALGAWFALRLPWLGRSMRVLWFPLLAAGLAGLTWVAVQGLPAWPLGLHRLLFPAAMAATVVGMAMAALRFEPAYERFAEKLTRAGSLSFGVYFIHPLLLVAVDGLVARSGAWPWQWWWFPLLVWLATSAGSFGATFVLGRWRATRWLSGLPPRRASVQRDLSSWS